MGTASLRSCCSSDDWYFIVLLLTDSLTPPLLVAPPPSLPPLLYLLQHTTCTRWVKLLFRERQITWQTGEDFHLSYALRKVLTDLLTY